MPDALYIHRRIITDDDASILQHIHYAYTEEGLVDILKVTAHYISKDGNVGPNWFDCELTYIMKMYLLSILIDDGIIEIP